MEISPQSKRLKVFIDSTGMSVREFSKQCKLPSSSSLHHVITNGKTPSAKLLDKIILRFPQLNYDWVLLGYGEMIVKGMQNQPANANSLKKSMDASYDNIQEYLENHDYALNYLANKIEKALLSSVKTFQQVNNRMDAFEQKQDDFIEFLNEHRGKAVEAINHQLETKLQEMKTAVESKSDQNTKKAIDFLLSIKKGTDEKADKVLGEFKKHTNPKPQK